MEQQTAEKLKIINFLVSLSLEQLVSPATLNASFMTLASHIVLWWENRSDRATSMAHK